MSGISTAPTRARIGVHILAILVVALLVRLPYFLHPYDSSDSDLYKIYARNLREDGTYSWSETDPDLVSAYRPPVYPLVLAATYSVFGEDDRAVHGVQLLLSCLACVLVYAIGLLLLPSTRVALAAGIVGALHPLPGSCVGTVLTETVFTSLLAGGALCIVLGCAKGRDRWLFTGGIVMALAALCRSAGQFLFLPLLAGIVFAGHSWRQRMRSAAVFLLGILLPILPWATYIHAHTGKPVITSWPGAGSALYMSILPEHIFHEVTNPDYRGAGHADARLGAYYAAINDRDDASAQGIETEMKEIALQRMLGRPVRYALERLRAHPYLWIGSSYLVDRDWFPLSKGGGAMRAFVRHAVLVGLHGLPLVLFLASPFLLRPLRPGWWVALLLPCCTAVSYAVHVSLRFSLPVYPYVLLLATGTAGALVRRCREWGQGARPE